jgi:Reverse transcriptase (RNA-dependent DNA polymerase)/RNase H-like domain found in reverse transcriptase
LGLRRPFTWKFVMAKTKRALLGADFIKNYGLLPDLANNRLIDSKTQLSVGVETLSVPNDEYENISSVNSAISSTYTELLKKFPDLTKPHVVRPTIKHEVKHYIETKGPPIFCTPRKLDAEKYKIAKEEFRWMLENDIIRASKSQWSNPLHLVAKKDSTWRTCGDYRRLNDVTIPDRYPLSNIQDVNYVVKDNKIFSKVDLTKAYYAIPLNESDKCKTAITTPFGLFEFNFMPFGLRNAPATFQRFIHEVVRDLDFCFAYLDDILIASKSLEEHVRHLMLLFERLNQYGLTINLAKSEFGKSEIEFLGHLISSNGSKPLPSKVEALNGFQLPETIKDLRSFLGFVNQYRRYIKHAAEHQALLHEYLRRATKNDRRKVEWTPEAISQFEKCKSDVANAAMLTIQNSKYPLGLFVDASDVAVGASIEQFEKEGWKPLGFFSKKLSGAEKNYSTYDRELLAIYLSVIYFKHMLEGRNFTIFTDHKPLIFAFKQKSEI